MCLSCVLVVLVRVCVCVDGWGDNADKLRYAPHRWAPVSAPRIHLLLGNKYNVRTFVCKVDHK